jgi:hypoxanthine-DNA glycosylase
MEGGVAVWDVVQEATRRGSLDAAIELATLRHNDVARLIDNHPSLKAIAFNGTTAQRLFAQRIQPRLAPRATPLAYLSLPSTSPANASIARATKLAAWQRLTLLAAPAPAATA